MRILLTGDSHGNGMLRAEQWALREKCEAIVIAGDIWDASANRKLPTHIIPGNHEQLPRGAFHNDGQETGETFGANVYAYEDYSTFQLGGVKWGTLGRMDEEDHIDLLEQGWWLGESYNRAFEKRPTASQILKGCDIILTHDAAHPFLYGGGGRPIGGSKFITNLLETVQPTLHFHGHTHKYQEKRIPNGNTLSISLPPCDTDFAGGYLVLEITSPFGEPWRFDHRVVINPDHVV